MSPGETILVTGAGGFIGGWVVETLYLTGSATVRPGLRGWSSAARLGRFPVKMVLCDVMDPRQLAQAMDGASHVIHCAYGSSEVTVGGTVNVMSTALALGVQRVVHLSTAEVYGYPTGTVDESFPLLRTGNVYADSKIDAEAVCWEYCAKGLSVTVVRPPIVYGPFGRTFTTELVEKLQSGNWGLFEGYGTGICNPIYVSDLVAGILLAARSPRAAGEAFNLNGPEVITWNEYFRRFNAALGLPELKTRDSRRTMVRAALRRPARAVAAFARDRLQAPLRDISQRSRWAREFMRSAEKTIRSAPRSADLRTLYNRNAYYTSAKAEKVLGFRPRFSVDAGLCMTARWLDLVGLLERSNLPEAVER